jgi:CRP-like cAMP-binding protein
MAEPELHAVAFPKLSEAQLAGLARCSRTRLRRFHAGEKLFEACDRDPRFFVVKSGEVEIIDDSGEKPATVTVHGPGEFTGDVGQVTGRPAIVSAVAHTGGEAYEVSPDALRELLNNHPEVGDLVMQAFIARRQLLTASGHFTGLRVIGSRYSRDTFRVRDFLSENRVRLSEVELVRKKTGHRPTITAPALFSFIGALPRTDWLPPEVERDAKGFVRTGPALGRSPFWSRRRAPFLLETSRAGVFAPGDVRSGSVKRVASAVGEGAMAVQFAHEYLKEM